MENQIKLIVKGVQHTPVTNFDSVYDEDGTNLVDTMKDIYEKLSSSGNCVSKDSNLVEVEEDGFYIADVDGNYVMSVNGNGEFNSVSYGSTLTNVLEDFKNEIYAQLPKDEISSTINADTVETIGTLNRTTDSGYIESKIYRKFVYLRNVSAGDKTISVTDDSFIYRDYLRVNCSVPFTYKNFNFNKGNLVDITLNFPNDYDEVWVEVNYSVASDEQVARVSIEIPTSETGDIDLTQATHPFNSAASIMWSIDDGMLGDYSYWCATHNYPAKEGNRGDIHAEDILNNKDNQTVLFDRFTFDDGCGNERLVEATHALMNIADTCSNGMYKNVSLLVEDLLLMESLGDSFAWHDITSNSTWDKELGDNVDLDYHLTYLKDNGLTGIKVAVTPSGIQNYAVIMQNKLSVVMCTVEGAADWTDPQSNITYTKSGLSRNASDWTTGQDIVSFRKNDVLTSPTLVYSRLFINSDNYESAKDYEDYFNISIRDNELRPFGFHGTGFSYVLPKMKQLLDNNKNVSYLSLDHLWEYYHIYNNMVIDDVYADGTKLSATLWIPHCQYERYGEITINCNIKNGGKPIVSDNVIGLSYKQNADRYTMNIAICPKWIKDRDYWKELHTRYPNNDKITRDYLYVDNLLREGLRLEN